MHEKPEALAIAWGADVRAEGRALCPYSVTALAMASSRHRFRMRKSPTLIGAPVSTARSVMDWQTSP